MRRIRDMWWDVMIDRVVFNQPSCDPAQGAQQLGLLRKCAHRATSRTALALALPLPPSLARALALALAVSLAVCVRVRGLRVDGLLARR
jgi:hypothetical protein